MNYSDIERKRRIERMKAMILLEENRKRSDSPSMLERQSSRALVSSVRETKYSSSNEDDGRSLRTCMKVPWKNSRKRAPKERVDFDVLQLQGTSKERLAKLSSSLAGVTCVDGAPMESREEMEDWRNYRGDMEEVPRSRVELDGSAQHHMKKVAFLSDMVDYSEEEDENDSVPSDTKDVSVPEYDLEVEDGFHEPMVTIFPGHSREAIGKTGTKECHDRVKCDVSPSSEALMRRNNMGMTRRMKTNMLALLENIDSDAGVWLGLRRDSFEVPAEHDDSLYTDENIPVKR